jgi:hypothetical protein
MAEKELEALKKEQITETVNKNNSDINFMPELLNQIHKNCNYKKMKKRF